MDAVVGILFAGLVFGGLFVPFMLASLVVVIIEKIRK